MIKNYLLKGYIKSGDVSVGPFTIDFDFDKKIPSSEQKIASLYVRVTKKTRVAIKSFYKLLNSRKEISFVSKSYYPKIILKGITHKTVRAYLDRTKLGEYKRLEKLYFETFEEKYGSSKNLLPKMVVFQIEDLVIFRPALRTKDNFFPKKGKPGYLRVAIRKYDNCLNFCTRDMMFETSCEISANILPRNQLKFKIAVNTRPYLMVKSRKQNQTENDILYAGENIRLLLSFLEERFIKYISKTIFYNTTKGKKPVWEFIHTHYSDPMSKPCRRDLREKLPMDKFTSSDIKTMFTELEKINEVLKAKNRESFSEVLYLYLNARQATMIYYPIVNYFACIERLFEIAKFLNYRLENKYKKTDKNKKITKAEHLCCSLRIKYDDLLDKNKKFGYLAIRQKYNHTLKDKYPSFEEIIDATDKACYLCRRIIFAFLGLDYRKYNSCDPTKSGQIGL